MVTTLIFEHSVSGKTRIVLGLLYNGYNGDIAFYQGANELQHYFPLVGPSFEALCFYHYCLHVWKAIIRWKVFRPCFAYVYQIWTLNSSTSCIFSNTWVLIIWKLFPFSTVQDHLKRLPTIHVHGAVCLCCMSDLY